MSKKVFNLPGLAGLLLCLLAVPAPMGRAQDPIWWRNSKALDPSKTANNSAAAAAGQAMHMAKSAYYSMNSIHGARYVNGQWGRGAFLGKIFADYEKALSRYGRDAVNQRLLRQGQLRYVSAPFWQRLQEYNDQAGTGVYDAPSNPYPWAVNPTGDDKLVNLGQVKRAFSFKMGRSLKSDSDKYQDLDYPVTTIPSADKLAAAYILEEFQSRSGNDNNKSPGKKGGLASTVWRKDGVSTSRSVLRDNFSTRYPGQPAGETKGFVRLAPVPDETQTLSSLELKVPLPVNNETGMSGNDYKHIYIQYRWRAFPDFPQNKILENITGNAAQVANRPGALVFCEPVGSAWNAWNSVGWERHIALAKRKKLGKTFYIGAFDLAFPVISEWLPDPNDSTNPDYVDRRQLRPDYYSTGAFNVKSPAVLGAGFPSNEASSVPGPQWRTTTIRIEVRNEGEDAMDIWLDSKPLGGERGARVSQMLINVPFYPTKVYANPLPPKARAASSPELCLRWNGLRNADFDIGAIYVGFRNPLFTNTADRHNGMPAVESASGNENRVGSTSDWMTPWKDDDIFKFDSNISRDKPYTWDQNSWFHSLYYNNSSHESKWYYSKLSVLRFLQNWHWSENTLPSAYILSPPSGFPNPPEPNPRTYDIVFSAGYAWEDQIDCDMDDLPDNWELLYFNNLNATPDGDNDLPGGDGIRNLDEYRAGLNPVIPFDWEGAGDDGDTLTNEWEYKNGYTPWDGVNQGNDDPDRDGKKNWEEREAETDPLVADGSGARVGTPPPVGFFSGPVHPAPPSTDGDSAAAWIKEGPTQGDDIDNDGVPNHLDAVPYDPNLSFARVPESQYIIVPLMGVDGNLENGVPVAINDAGHILLRPQDPDGGWAAYPGPGMGGLNARAPKLWKKPGQAAVKVTMPTAPSSYTSFWDHAGARDRRTLDLDLAKDSDLVLAHVRLQGPSTPPLPTLPSTVDSANRIPNLQGRHAFVWNETSAAYLPWATLDVINTNVPRFLTHGTTPVPLGDSTLSMAGRLLSGHRISGTEWNYAQVLKSGTNYKNSEEFFDFFSWTSAESVPGTHIFSSTGAASGRGLYSFGEEKKGYSLFLHNSPDRRVHYLSWGKNAIIEDVKESQDQEVEPISTTSWGPTAREQDVTARRRGATDIPATSAFYFRSDPWAGGNPVLISSRHEKGYQPFVLNDAASGPFIIGAPGRYWIPKAGYPSQLNTGWLYSHSGYEDTERGFGAGERVPFEISRDARVNNQGIIICEDRLWRNGRGHNIKDLVSNGTGYSGFELHAINDLGVIAATAVNIYLNDRVPIMLVPIHMDFLVQNLESEQAEPLNESIPEIQPVPNVSINITSANISNDTLNLGVSFEIHDELSELPSITPLSGANVYINGELKEQITGLGNQMQLPDYPVWQARKSKIVLSRNYSIPAKAGIYSVSINTLNNAAGKKGFASNFVKVSKHPLSPQVVPQSQWPVLRLPVSLSNSSADIVQIKFPNHSFANLTESSTASKHFIGNAIINGISRQVKIILKSIDSWSASAIDSFGAEININGVTIGNYTGWWRESGVATREFSCIEFNQSENRPDLFYVEKIGDRPVQSLGSVDPFVIRFSQGSSLSSLIGTGNLYVLKLNDIEVPLQDYSISSSEGLGNAYISQAGQPRLFAIHSQLDGNPLSPSGAISNGNITLKIQHRSSGSVMWSETREIIRSNYFVSTNDFEEEEEDPTENIPISQLTDEQFKDRMIGELELWFGEYGTLLLQKATSAPISTEIKFTSIWGIGSWDNWALDNCTDGAWQDGKHPVIRIDRNDLETPTKAATALFDALHKMFHGFLSPNASAFKPAPTVVVDPEIDPDFAATVEDLLHGRYGRMAEALNLASSAAESGISIISGPGGLILSVAGVVDSMQSGDTKSAAIQTLLMMLPSIGSQAAKKSIEVEIKFKYIKQINGAAHEVIGKLVLPEESDGLTRALGYMAAGNRVLAMRELRPLIEQNEIDSSFIEKCVNIGFLTPPKSDYKVLQAYIELRNGGVKWPKASTRRHHDLPVGRHKFKGVVYDFTLEFLKRGIDPNDGMLGGRFLKTKFHTIIHANIEGMGKENWGQWPYNGGPFNYQWFAFFKENPSATAQDILDFLDHLVDKTEENPAVNHANQIQWPYWPPP